MLIRVMTETDLEQVAAIEKRTFSEPWSKDGFRDALESENALFLVAEEDTIVQGYIGMYLSVPEAEITNVAVDEVFRTKGIGEGLISAIQQQSIKAGVNQIFLEVRDSNVPAIRLYTKMGFAEIGKRKNFYSFPKEDARVMMWQMD